MSIHTKTLSASQDAIRLRNEYVPHAVAAGAYGELFGGTLMAGIPRQNNGGSRKTYWHFGDGVYSMGRVAEINSPFFSGKNCRSTGHTTRTIEILNVNRAAIVRLRRGD